MTASSLSLESSSTAAIFDDEPVRLELAGK
jgi:hypothetical protein